jgi:hypothetical protein
VARLSPNASRVGRGNYFVNVNRRLVNLDRIANSLDRPLAIDESPAKEMLAFFKCIQITPDRSLPSSLFSLARIRLGERSLTSSGETATWVSRPSTATAAPASGLASLRRPSGPSTQ